MRNRKVVKSNGPLHPDYLATNGWARTTPNECHETFDKYWRDQNKMNLAESVCRITI